MLGGLVVLFARNVVNGEVAAKAAAPPATLMNSLRLIGAIMALLVHQARASALRPLDQPRARYRFGFESMVRLLERPTDRSSKRLMS